MRSHYLKACKTAILALSILLLGASVSFAQVTLTAAPNAEAGKEVFSDECSVCHGATGHGGNGGPDLTTMPKAKEQKGAEEQVQAIDGARALVRRVPETPLQHVPSGHEL